jgi:aryl-alcohol dehydrogenase-like predicted oxidoreductase
VIPTTRFGRTELNVTRLALGGFPFGAVNRARNWDPYTPEGRQQAIQTIDAALDAGINYIDTAPGYGQGHSESIVGEAMVGQRDRSFVATKVGYRKGGADEVRKSVEASLARLQMEAVDVIQFHGGMYTQAEVDRILSGGLLAELERLRDEGKVRFIGFTVEEPWTARPLLRSNRFDMMQIRYNLIYQAAAHHVLDEAREADLGIAVMRPMTSGMFQRIAEYIAPEWQEAHDIYDAALKFVLSDSRVHVANVGMRWPAEVARNADLLESFKPAFDMADIPRWTADIYRTEDERRDDG